MKLFDFLESNWFAITCLIGLGAFLIRTTTAFNKMCANNDKKLDDFKLSNDKKLDDFKISIDDRFDIVETNIGSINNRLDDQEQKRLEGTKRTRIIMGGVEATLVTLHNLGHNGPVTASLKEIDEYKSEKASQ